MASPNLCSSVLICGYTKQTVAAGTRMQNTTGLVADADVAAFERDGVVCLSRVFADWVELLRAGVERNIAAPSPKPSGAR